MRVLPRVAGLNLRDRVGSADIQKELQMELLLLGVQMSHLRRVWHRIKMPLLVLLAVPTG